MVYVGWKHINVNFTVHKVEPLNFKERGGAGVGKILKRSWRVFEFSPPTWARSTFYISAAWFGLLLIFLSDGAMMILAVNLRTPKRVPSGQTLCPKHRGHCTVYRELTRCPWSWPGWLEKVLPVGNIYPSLFMTKTTAIRWERLLPSYPCSDFLSSFSLVKHDFFSQGPRSPMDAHSIQEWQWHLSVALEMLEKLITIRKNPKSVKENTSQWESELLSASNTFQVVIVLWYYICFIPL